LKPPAIGGSDAGALLASVLESKKGKKGKPGYVFIVGIDTKNTACLVQISLPLNSGVH